MAEPNNPTSHGRSSHGRFVWYELMTTDMAAASAFYAKVVGWGIEDASMPGMAYSLFTVAGISVGGAMGVPADAKTAGVKPGWIGYVGVDDVDAAADRVRQLGGAVHVPPTDIPNISRFAVASDPQKAAFVLVKWLRPRHGEPAELSAPGYIRWHELFAADWEKAFAFYAELFGWQNAGTDIDAAGAYRLFAAHGQTIGGMFTKPPARPVPFWLYYFNVDDIDAAAKRVKAGGGDIVNGPMQVLEGNWIVECVDPQAVPFALVGQRSRTPIGYFERTSGDPSKPRDRRWSW
ncbi:MAG TPA: VOC family protein [Xanthobacteraceae bacterium]